MATDPTEFCTYTTVKIDDQVIPAIKAAAALTGVSVQEYVSDHMNVISHKEIARKPVKRRPPPPKRPRKSD